MLRLPQSLSTQLSRDAGPSALEREILGEKAASLGRAGRLVETALGDLNNFCGASGERPRIVQRAADAVHAYFVQRELCGLPNHDAPIMDYAIPAEVLARVGAR